MTKPTLTREKAYELALQRGLIDKPKLTKERAHQLALERGLIQPEKSQVGQSLARGAKNVLTGVLDTADLIATPVREALNVGLGLAGSDYKFRPTGQMTSEAIDKATEGYTEATTPGQKVEESIVRSLASMPIGGGIGSIASKAASKGVQAVGKTLQGGSHLTPSNIALTGASSGLMQHHLNENPEDLVGAIGMGLLPGVAHGIVNLSHSGNLANSVGRKLGINPYKVKDFLEAGVNPTLADVSDNKITKTLSHIGGYTPGASRTIRNAKEIQRNQLLKELGQGDYGDEISKARASFLTHEGAKTSHVASNKKHGDMFSKLEGDIQRLPDKSIELHETGNTIRSLLKNVKDQPKFFKTPAGKKINDIIGSISNKNHDYYGMKEILDDINDTITTHGLIGKASEGKLKRLAQSIGQDIDTSLTPRMKELGEDAYSNWKDARNTYREYATGEIPHLNEMLKANKKGATDAFFNLMTNVKKGGEKARIVFKGLNPQEREELIHGINQKLGETKEGGFNPLKWSSNFKALEPSVKDTLTEGLSKHSKQKLDAIINTIDHLKSTLKESNTSLTAHHTALKGDIAAIAGASSSLASGHVWPAVSLAIMMGTNRLGAALLTNPKLINWAYNGMRMKHIGQFERHLARLNSIPGVPTNTLRVGTALQKYLGPQKEKYAKGGHVRNKYADGGPTIEELYPGMEDAIAEYGKFIGKNKGTGEGFSPEYIKEVKDQVLKEANEDGYFRNQLKNKDWGFLNNLNLVESNKKSGGAQKKNAFGQTREEALKPINQAFITSEDKDIANNKGVKYLRELYKKAQDPNASWNDINDAVFASEMLSQGYDYTGNMWKKDDTDILSAIRDIPIVGDIAKATGVDRMVSNMDNLIKSKDIGEGFKNALTFAADTGSTLASAISNPGKFATDAVTNLAMDKLTPSSKSTEQYEGQQYGYPQQYQQYGYQSYSPYSQPYGGGYNPYGYNQSSPYGYQQSMSHMAPNSQITQTGYHSYGSNQQSTMNQSGNQYTANPNFNTSSYQHQYDKPQ